ncbi:MAG: UDP-4-amino-4,6-dideoxy-N-acetyl-beta-L-altrosamine transaminase [Pseudomonadota bacterium]
MSKPFLPYGQQEITDADIQAVVEALKSPFLTTGPRVSEFEEGFANYLGVANSVAVANGTAALHLACLALGVKPGDVVLAPTMSFAASTNGAAYAGAEIEFIDCDPETGLITPETFAEAADRAIEKGSSPKVAIIVHINGEHADMAGISVEAGKRNIELIEDCCHALGTTFVDHLGEVQMVGNCRYSVLSTYSTHPVKTITTGEGGLITTKDVWLAKKLKDLRNHGMERDPENFQFSELAFDKKGEPNPWYYEIQSLGYNYRLTDVACALGSSQISRMHQIAEKRRTLKKLYDGFFNGSNMPLKTIPTAKGVDPVRHLYPILIDYDMLRIEKSTFCNALKAMGIGTQVHYIPTHLQPYYRKRYKGLSMEGAEAYYRQVLSLPFFPKMVADDVERVVDAVRTALDGMRFLNGKGSLDSKP